MNTSMLSVLFLLLLELLNANWRCSNDSLLGSAFQRCYYFLLKPTTHYNSQRFCEKYDAKMLIADSEDEAEFVTEILKLVFENRANVSGIWIGSRFIDDEFRVIDELRALPFDNWDKGEPAEKTEHHCVMSSIQTGKWSSENCDIYKPTVCTSSAMICNKHPVPFNPYIDHGYRTAIKPKSDNIANIIKCGIDEVYIDLLGSCFRFVDQPKMFFDAFKFCEEIGGTMLKIDSQLKGIVFSKIADNLFPQNTTKYWLGGTRLLGRWQWFDESKITNAKWSQGFPRNGFNEQCLASDRKGEWSSTNCYTTMLPYVCTKSTLDMKC